LDLTQIEAGKMQIFIEEIQLAELLQQCITLVAPLLLSHKIKIVDHITPCKTHVVYADPLRLKQALINLLSNAIKYNREGGTVTLECIQLPDNRLRIRVSDEGKGIPADKLDQLFQPFNRADVEPSSCIEGTGIGLAISKKLVELMGGEIGVTSTPGIGSCFWIELSEVPGEELMPNTSA
jgi:signal transduction histidine kinase